MSQIKGKYIEENTIPEVALKISNAPINDMCLMADSSASGGLKWGNAGATSGNYNVDGGAATSVYLPTQLIDGGSAGG